MQAYHLKGGKVLLYRDGRFSASDSDIFVKDGIISSLDSAEGEEEYIPVDVRGKLIMPGMINLHTHAYMTLMRNYADDVDFEEWLFKRVMPVEDSLPPECAYFSSLLACMEMISTGTTCFMDMHMYPGQPGRAAREAGIRAYIGRGLVGDELDPANDRRFLEALSEMEAAGKEEQDLIRFTIAPHAIYSCSPAFYQAAAREGRKRGLLLQTHLSESLNEVENCRKQYGKSPVEVLADSGFLGPDVIAAHCVRLSGRDLELLAATGTNIVTNPASNAKLGNGFAPIRDIRQAGINLCLGTDGAASNNTLNLFREMGLFTLIHKGIEESSMSVPSNYVLECVTVNAAKALGRQGELGEIRPGAQADLVILDLNSVSLFPWNNIPSSLCYSANGSEVESVMIGGRFVMRDRQFLTIDKERVFYEINRIAKNL